MTALAAVSVALLAVRLYAATRVGFGDSEALYACWAAHPQPAYLDHPGLVGLVARVIGEGAIPPPLRTHVVTSFAATLVPWLVYAVARAIGAEKKPALAAALVVALVPEIAVGLFALTPDLLLAPAWLGAIALASIGLSSPPRSSRAAGALLGAGLLAGVAAASKASGVLLFASLVVTYAVVARSERPEAPAARSVWPWAGLLTGAIVLLPVVGYEAQKGFPMLRHRLVDTQADAGVALRNVGALLGGQLLYLSPVVAWVAIRIARDLVKTRARDATSILLFTSFALPLVPLVVLCLWSRVAEPHWIAPALLALPLAAARRPETLGRRLVTAGAAVAAAFTVLAHAWVLTPLGAALMPSDADPKLDISSELYGWPTALDAVREQMKSAATPFDPEGREVVVVGPHWTVCAQLHAGLPGVRVGCATPVPDDFDGWVPRDEWRSADHVLFVTDNRFGGDGGDQLPLHVPLAQGRVSVVRGGRVARVFELYLYAREASTDAWPIPRRRTTTGSSRYQPRLRGSVAAMASPRIMYAIPSPFWTCPWWFDAAWITMPYPRSATVPRTPQIHPKLRWSAKPTAVAASTAMKTLDDTIVAPVSRPPMLPPTIRRTSSKPAAPAAIPAPTSPCVRSAIMLAFASRRVPSRAQ